MEKKQIEPSLFGQTHNNSSRDYSREYYWGKNQFNSSFPASLVAYMNHAATMKDCHRIFVYEIRLFNCRFRIVRGRDGL